VPEVKVVQKPEPGFAWIPNDTAQDETISARAVGLLGILQSLPDGYSVTKQRLSNKFMTEGTTALQTAINELKNAGLLETKKLKNENGQFTGTLWILLPKRQAKTVRSENEPQADYPSKDKPMTDSPMTGNRSPRNKELKKDKEEKNTTPQNPSSVKNNSTSPDSNPAGVNEVVVNGEPLRKKLQEIGVNQIETSLAALPVDPSEEKIQAAIAEVESGKKGAGHLAWVLQNLDVYTPPSSIQVKLEEEREAQLQSEMDRIVSLIATRNDLENEPLPEKEILKNEHISEDALERLLDGRLQRCSEGLYLPSHFENTTPSEESFIEHLEDGICPFSNPVEYARENDFTKEAVQLAREVKRNGTG
jgi:hypothetical protein